MLDVNMVERSRRSGGADDAARRTQAIQVEGLSAEFSTGQRPDGEWFALGTVRAAGERFDGLPWIVVGTGASQNDAIAELTEKVSLAAEAMVAR